MAEVSAPHGRPWVAEDLDDLPDDGYRREIIDGVLIVSPAPRLRHQDCVLELAIRLRAAESKQCKVIISPFDWRPPTGENFEPDVLVIRRRDADPDGLLRATPLLVVEVLSPSSIQYDRAMKRAAYERLKVPAYWIVDPKEPSVTVLRLGRSQRYEQVASATGERCLAVDFPFHLEFTPAGLRDS